MNSTTRVITTTVTLPPALRDRMDAAAVVLERPRSWVAAKAIAEWLERHPTTQDAAQ
jgi:predicted transcriptional regulator